MNKIELSSQGITLVTIEFRDHPFVNKWFEHWRYINSNYSLMFAARYQFPVNVNITTPTLDDVKEAIDCIRDAAIYLNSITNTHMFPYDLDNLPSYEVFLKNDLEAQLHLNRFHRYFTTGVKTPHGKDLLDNGMIKNEMDAKNWLNRIQEINQAVHKLDNSTRTPNLSNTTVLDTMAVIYSLHDKNMFLAEGTHHTITPEECLDVADDSTNWDVWMRVDLLGKDYMTGFVNHDDPTEWDIQYLNTYTGNFQLYMDKTPVDFCKSEAFNDWLHDYGMEYDARMCGIPLGKLDYIIDNVQEQDTSNLLIQEL